MHSPITWSKRHTTTGLLLTLLISVFSVSTSAYGQSNAPLDKLKAMAADVNNEPDLAEAALLGAQLIRPALDVPDYLSQLDEMAAELNAELRGVNVAVDALTTMANYLYGIRGYANSQVLPADAFVGLDQVLDGQQWNCVGMALLYASLGQRTNIPLKMVAGFGHVFVAYTGVGTFYVETTAGGRLEENRAYLREYLPFPCVDPASYVPFEARSAVALCLTQMGIAMQTASRTELARTLYSLALDFDPEHAEAHGGLAFLAGSAGNLAEAISGFEKAISLNPDFREAYGGLGNALNAAGDLSGAVVAYRNYVAQCPDDEAGVFNLAQLLYDQEDLAGSIEAYDRYIELVPEDPEGYLRIAFPLEDMGNLARAAAAYEHVLQRVPNHLEALSNLGYLYEQQGNFTMAMEGYQRALDAQPNHVQSMAGVARVLGKTNRYSEAVRTFSDAVRYNPNVSFLWIDFGHLFEDYGDFKKAVGAYQEATRVAPLNTEGYYALADALDSLGLDQDAAGVRSQARRIDDELARNQAVLLPDRMDTTEPLENEIPDSEAPIAMPEGSTMPEETMDEPTGEADSIPDASKPDESPPATAAPKRSSPATVEPTPPAPRLPSTKSNDSTATVGDAAP